MDKSLFRYIWRWSKRDQLIIFAVVIASLPFYYVSLDLPRKIVNEAIQGHAFEQGRQTAPFLNFSLAWPGWLGGGDRVELFGGFQLGRFELLLGLSFLFLFFVLVNGLFKYWINVAKGALGERMMRRLRFELFSFALRFTPQALRTVKSTEAATIIKDEVEPIGGFIGDAFIQPVFLGTQAATALIFILMQSVWLGLLAAGVVGIQLVIIPRMRRELLRLGRMRQIASRRLAGRIGEVIDGAEAVHGHGTPAWERAEVGGRLYELFDIRFKIYKRKFIVKFLNNLLAQMTPFFFYAVGGYFALSGQLDIGQLVAVIAAYRELPPPLKELIDWDQQRLDVQVKYDQIVGYFAADKLMSVHEETKGGSDEPLAGRLTLSHAVYTDGHGNAVLEADGVGVDLPTSLALVSDGGQGASALARLIARREVPDSGEVKVGEQLLSDLSPGAVGRRIAYAGPDPVLFPGTLRDNLLYGLRQRQIGEVEAGPDEARRIYEAKLTGNPVETTQADWVDVARSGAADADELDHMLVDLLKRVGLEQDIYRFGIAGMIDPQRHPALAEKIVEARVRLQARLHEGDTAELVEPFDPERYNDHATLGENLLFGVPTSPDLTGRALAENPDVQDVLRSAKLTDDLFAMGLQIAEQMTEIFRGLPPSHPLFDQFSFFHAEELPEFEQIVKRGGIRGRGGPTREDRARLIALPFAYIEPRHRLGLLNDERRGKILEARHRMREMLEKRAEPGVDFYDVDKVTPAAPLRDNLLFGRTNEGIANARERVRDIAAEVIDEFDLRNDIEGVGLDHQVGPAGRLLTATQRACVNLIRCVVKRPDIVVVDGGLAAFGERRTEELVRFLRETMEGRTLVVVLPNDRHAAEFDTVLSLEGTRVVEGVSASAAAVQEPAEADDDEAAAAERSPEADPLGEVDDKAPQPQPARTAAE